ncbi:uncharacterized protein LOC110431123 [Sorghum bicolor]|uniref:uncharacterized protein LOC110431123 n=1 Tax=Sorghum bicolor TaxID=4558 RepID=UPI000B425474|nr:uncharacterized protein LOC110431123 [Sorghum bicolor]|eukprot:XP_021305504.1 uncharacterized protein LOC110431123 [Sorghum bicolor]
MGNNCPETQEDAAFINNGFRQQQQQGNGWNNQNRPQGNSSFNSGFSSSQPLLKDLVLGQAKINENLVKKLSFNDKMFENLNTKLDSLTTSFKEQASFNKRVMSQIDQLASAAKSAAGVENVSSVTTRGGKTTRDPPNPNHGTAKTPRQQEQTSTEPVDPQDESSDQEPTLEVYGDTTMLPFPTRWRKKKKDGEEQFLCFVEMVEKTNVSVPLMDVLHIPSYAMFIEDIINNKRPLPSVEVVKLTEECSAAILNHLPEKKQDPGCPTITCSIGTQHFDHALCDLGASVSVMPKSVFDRLNFTNLEPTNMTLQLADSSIRYLAGIAQDIPVRIRGYYVPMDFVVLNMELTKETPLILGRPLLSTTKAQIDVGAGEIRFNINGQEEKFEFRPHRPTISSQDG